MPKGKKFAEIRDGAGNTLVEMIGPGRNDDALSIGLRLLTQQLIAKGHGDESGAGGFFGGTYGYGIDFENDVFEMHYDRQDYDCDCGASEPKHADSCDVLTKAEAHRRARMDFATDKKTDAERDSEIAESIARGMPKRMAILGACGSTLDFKRMMEFDETHPWPACSCGAAEAFVERDDHARNCRRSIAERPNFYHKLTGLTVRWYKYIGRDNEVEVGSAESLKDVLESCLASFSGGTLEVAAKEYAQAEEASAKAHNKAMRFWMTDEEPEAADAEDPSADSTGNPSTRD
jgi:hypothetical protein